MQQNIKYINKCNSGNNKTGVRLLISFIVAGLIAYLIFHLLSGERGLYAMLKEERKLELLKQELTIAENERKELATKVRLMSSNSVDLDMLDEQARIVLDAAGTDEVVISNIKK